MQRLPTEALRKGVEEEKNSLPFPPNTKYFVSHKSLIHTMLSLRAACATCV